MSGTKAGGLKTAETNRSRYGKDFYSIQGAKGGAKSTGGGFATKSPCDCSMIDEPHIRPQCAGLKGGRISRKSKNG